MPHIEALTKALHAAHFSLSDLQAAMKTASPLESLLLADLIAQQRAVVDRLHAIIALQPASSERGRSPVPADWAAGDVYAPGDNPGQDLWLATIDVGGHGSAIECHGETRAAAEALRSAVMR